MGGLYDPRFEHDACGLAAVVRLDGVRTHEVVAAGVEALRNMDHRGASGSDPETGDGAGILLQVPDAFFRRVVREELQMELPPPGQYAVGMAFLPREPGLRLRCEELFVRICAEEGHRALGWRDVPVRSDRIGELARLSEPVVRQLFVERRGGDDEAFERKLAVIRRRVEKEAGAGGVEMADFSVVSLSSRTIVYKGLLRARQLDATTPIWRLPTSPPRWCSCTRGSRRTRLAPGIWRIRSTFSATTARSTRCAATAPG